MEVNLSMEQGEHSTEHYHRDGAKLYCSLRGRNSLKFSVRIYFRLFNAQCVL